MPIRTRRRVVKAVDELRGVAMDGIGLAARLIIIIAPKCTIMWTLQNSYVVGRYFVLASIVSNRPESADDGQRPRAEF